MATATSFSIIRGGVRGSCRGLFVEPGRRPARNGRRCRLGRRGGDAECGRRRRDRSASGATGGTVGTAGAGPAAARLAAAAREERAHAVVRAATGAAAQSRVWRAGMARAGRAERSVKAGSGGPVRRGRQRDGGPRRDEWRRNGRELRAAAAARARAADSGGGGVTRSAGCGKAPTLKNSPDHHDQLQQDHQRRPQPPIHPSLPVQLRQHPSLSV